MQIISIRVFSKNRIGGKKREFDQILFHTEYPTRKASNGGKKTRLKNLMLGNTEYPTLKASNGGKKN